ncbi:MAG: PorV/PorQ family protein [Vicingaceae bacterium]
MKKHISYLLFALLLLLNHGAWAQLIPNFGAQRAGLTTLSFLKNDLNPRSSALAGASVALEGDGYATLTNPAGITDVNGFNATISNYSLGAGIQHSFASVILPRKNELSAFGFSLNMLNSGEMEVRTEFQPEGTGEKFYATNMAFAATYAQKLSDMFSAGISLKYIHEQMADYSNGTVAADVSFLYYTDYKDLQFAVMVQNFGGNSALNGDDLKSDFNRTNTINADNYGVPTVFSLGASIVPWEVEKQSLLVSLQLNHPSDNAENYRLGVEYQYLELLFLRAGYKLNVEGQPFPTFGFGLRHRIGGHPLRFDYGANPTEFQGLLHTVGISFTLNKMGRE